MSEFKGTPGPWHSIPSETFKIKNSAGQYIAFVRLIGEYGSEDLANLALMQAAPELLDQLKGAVKHIQTLEETLDDVRRLKGMTIAICGATYDPAKARAAIAKATES